MCLRYLPVLPILHQGSDRSSGLAVRQENQGRESGEGAFKGSVLAFHRRKGSWSCLMEDSHLEPTSSGTSQSHPASQKRRRDGSFYFYDTIVLIHSRDPQTLQCNACISEGLRGRWRACMGLRDESTSSPPPALHVPHPELQVKGVETQLLRRAIFFLYP